MDATKHAVPDWASPHVWDGKSYETFTKLKTIFESDNDYLSEEMRRAMIDAALFIGAMAHCVPTVVKAMDDANPNGLLEKFEDAAKRIVEQRKELYGAFIVRLAQNGPDYFLNDPSAQEHIAKVSKRYDEP